MLLLKIIEIIRPLGGRRYAASTQLNYTQEMYRSIKEIMKINMYEYQQGRALIRKIRTQSYLETVKAPVETFENIRTMFRTICDDERQYTLMLIAFMTAARIGHMHCLLNRGQCKAGWRFTWASHKTFYLRGSVDVVIPEKCIPAELQPLKTTLALGPVCTESEMTVLYDMLEDIFKGRTYTIRRSSLQHMRYTLKMSIKDILPISLHAQAQTLEGYLASPVEFE